jgi:hypothetical protein
LRARLSIPSVRTSFSTRRLPSDLGS